MQIIPTNTTATRITGVTIAPQLIVEKNKASAYKMTINVTHAAPVDMDRQKHFIQFLKYEENTVRVPLSSHSINTPKAAEHEGNIVIPDKANGMIILEGILRNSNIKKGNVVIVNAIDVPIMMYTTAKMESKAAKLIPFFLTASALHPGSSDSFNEVSLSKYEYNQYWYHGNYRTNHNHCMFGIKLINKPS